jgi:biofilm protein TabA
MIVDALSLFAHYNALHRHFSQAFQALQSLDLLSMEDGSYDIVQDTIRVIIETASPNPHHTPILEAHRAYIDIQYCIEGEFCCGWKSLELCTSIQSDYSEKNDIIFFEDAPSGIVHIPQGHFAIFFPSDAHAPMAPNLITKKAIVKIAV